MKNRRKWMKIDASLARMASKLSPLLRYLPGQQDPCPAYIQIEPSTRVIEAVVDARRPRVAAIDVQRGTLIRIAVPPSINGDPLLRFCRSHSVQALMRRVCDGWNLTEDSGGRVRGAPDDSAGDALLKLIERAKRELQAQPSFSQLSLDWSNLNSGTDESSPISISPDSPHDFTQVRIHPDTQLMQEVNAPLYFRRKRAASAAPAYVVITPATRTVHAEYDVLYGKPVPREVHQGLRLRVAVPSNVRGRALVSWLNRTETLELIGRVCDGWKKHVDSAGRVAGQLDEAASDSLDALLHLVELNLTDDVVEFWEDVTLWLGTNSIRHLWPDGSLEDAADKLYEEATRNGIVFENGVESVVDGLLSVVGREFQNRPETMRKHYVKALAERGYISPRCASEWIKQYSE